MEGIAGATCGDREGEGKKSKGWVNISCTRKREETEIEGHKQKAREGREVWTAHFRPCNDEL